MKKRINYGDNLFLLTLILKDLEAAARLNIDPDFFLDKFVEDIFFLDASIGRFLTLLNENSHLIDRLEHLKGLQGLSQSMADFLKDLQAGRYPISEYLKSFGERFAGLEEDHRRIVSQVEETVRSADARNPEQEDTVSEREFQFLLASEEEVSSGTGP